MASWYTKALRKTDKFYKDTKVYIEAVANNRAQARKRIAKSRKRPLIY